jgi:hypothetical protein
LPIFQVVPSRDHSCTREILNNDLDAYSRRLQLKCDVSLLFTEYRSVGFLVVLIGDIQIIASERSVRVVSSAVAAAAADAVPKRDVTYVVDTTSVVAIGSWQEVRRQDNQVDFLVEIS